MFAPRLAAAFVVLLGAGFATGQTGPQLLTVFPPGAKSGDTVEVTFSGGGFDGGEQLLFSAKGFKSELVSGSTVVDPKTKQPGMKGPPVNAVKFKVTVPKEVPLGMHDVRVVSKSGLSNPRTFVVGDLTEVNEIEPNNDVGQAQKIELNTTVNGVISAPTDVDYVIFKAKAGQSVVVACLTSTIDSKLSADLLVSTSEGKPIAANRGYRNGDAVLDFKAPTDGDYLVRVAQFAYTTGGTDHFYRLMVTTGPWVDAVWPPLVPATVYALGRNLPNQDVKIPLDDRRFPESRLGPNRPIPPSSGMLDAMDSSINGFDGNLLLHTTQPVILDNEKNHTSENAQTVKVPCDVAGRIGKKNDRHWYSFEAKKGDVWTIEVFADRLGSPISPFFVVADDKGKVIARLEDSGDSLSPNQFYTKSDDPARYRFLATADGTYKVMVSSIEAGIQFGIRDQYVLRIAPERPGFQLAVMPITPHLTDAGTLPKNGAVLFSVFVFRFDGFTDAITLSAANLPPGVHCPPQVIGVGQTRGTLVFTADKDAKDWDGFVKITCKSKDLEHLARPFSITWSAQGLQANQPPPNIPMITRMDRGPGLALAIRGDAPFMLTPTEKELKAKAGDKLEVTVKVTRDEKFKDGIQVFSAVPNFGPRQQGNQPLPPITTLPADKTEAKIIVDVPANLAPGTYTLVLRGQSAAAAPKAATTKPVPTYPTVPITVTIEGKEPTKKK